MIAPPPPAIDLLWLLRDPETTAGLAGFASMARRHTVDVPFVAGVATGSVTPTVTVKVPKPRANEVGLLIQLTVRLSVQRLVNLTVTADNGDQVLSEQPAIGGVKKLSGQWLAFQGTPQVVIYNPSASFYCAGQVYAPVIYLDKALYASMQAVLVDSFRQLLRLRR